MKKQKDEEPRFWIIKRLDINRYLGWDGDWVNEMSDAKPHRWNEMSRKLQKDGYETRVEIRKTEGSWSLYSVEAGCQARRLEVKRVEIRLGVDEEASDTALYDLMQNARIAEAEFR